MNIVLEFDEPYVGPDRVRQYISISGPHSDQLIQSRAFPYRIEEDNE